jgi:hypothetical protein
VNALWQTFLDSRKWKLAVGGVIFAIFGEPLGLSQDQVQNALNMIMALVVGQGVVDAGKAVAEKK